MKKALWLLAAGFGIGLLLAPRKGSETWAKIVDYWDDMTNDAQNRIDELKNGGKDAFRKVRREAKDALSEANRNVSETVH